MREELARCCSPAKYVIEPIAAVRGGSYNTFTCSIRSCSREPAAEWLAPDVLHGSETSLTGYNRGDEEMCFLSQKKKENSPRWFLNTLKGTLFLHVGLNVFGCI